MTDDTVWVRLADERIRRKREAAQIRQAVVIGTNLGYSTIIAAAVDLLTSAKPKLVPDCVFTGVGFFMLALTLIFAPYTEV